MKFWLKQWRNWSGLEKDILETNIYKQKDRRYEIFKNEIRKGLWDFRRTNKQEDINSKNFSIKIEEEICES